MVSNKARFLVWIVLMILGYLGGLWINYLISLPCGPAPCITAGIILLVVIGRAAGVTGRYLRVYGKSSPEKSFGELDRLVTIGPYSCMRHPMHFYLSLTPIAIGLLTINPGFAYITGPIETLLILLMAVVIDERESVERFGEAYLEYRRRVPAFNLHPSCLWLALKSKPQLTTDSLPEPGSNTTGS